MIPVFAEKVFLLIDHRHLHGGPSRRLVKEVRSHLWRHGMRPVDEPWQLTWAWASGIGSSYMRFRWPMPHEIATLYMILLIHRTADHRTFHVAYRARDAMPDSVKMFIAQAVGERQINPFSTSAQLAETLVGSDQVAG